VPGWRPAATVEPTEARAHHVAFEIIDSAAVAARVAAARAEPGPLGIIINNAATGAAAGLPDDA
jgi:hypothetical protein